MPYCLTHGLQQGKHCPECGALLSDSPPDSGDSIRVRSPEATAIVNIAPGTKAPRRPAEVECPRCGHFNALRNTFNCKGECSGQNLCRWHFDEEYPACKWCADERRGIAKAEAERQAKLHADLASWRQRAEQAEAQAAELGRQGEQAQKALEKARAELRLAQQRVRELEQELAGQRRRTEQAEASAAALTQRSQQAEADLATRTTELRQAQERIRLLDKDLTMWRRQAEEATQQQPIWQQIGIQLIRIPMGAFLMGSDPALDGQAFAGEQPQHPLYLPDYELARTPVTVAQFAAFVQATGHQTTAEKEGVGGVWVGGRDWKWVKGADWRHPRGPDSDVQELANHSVTQVSWHDAQAFCRWAGLRLPTEAEWEKGARGVDGRIYPWGSEKPAGHLLNFADRNVDLPWADQSVDDGYQFTSPVGNYPAGASPYGLLDMAGNVWEWTSSRWGKEANKPDFGYPYDATDGREEPAATDRRVSRGGSWDDDTQGVRAAVRVRNSPDNCNNDLGFRPARSP